MSEIGVQNVHGRWVEIEFDCLPLRSVSRTDVPLDASPKLAAKMLRIREALQTHGTHNSYFLHNASCTFHLTNDPLAGMLRYSFDGVVLTDAKDLRTHRCEISVALAGETCSWVNQAIVDWLGETVRHAVLVEFNRYIQNGDLNRTLERIRQVEQASEETGGFVGMYL